MHNAHSLKSPNSFFILFDIMVYGKNRRDKRKRNGERVSGTLLSKNWTIQKSLKVKNILSAQFQLLSFLLQSPI